MGNPIERVCETCKSCGLEPNQAEEFGFPRYHYQHPNVVKTKIPLKEYERLIKEKGFYCLRNERTIGRNIQKHTCLKYNERLLDYRLGYVWDPEQGTWHEKKGGRSG